MSHHFTRCSHTPDGARIILLCCTVWRSADRSRQERHGGEEGCYRTSVVFIQTVAALALLLLLLLRTTLPHREGSRTEADEGAS